MQQLDHLQPNGNQDSENEIISNHQQENHHCYCFAALRKSNEVFDTTDKHDVHKGSFDNVAEVTLQLTLKGFMKGL